MEKIQGIEVREVEDLGPVIARADHQDNAIEVNRRIFYGLPPMAQEFVLCHEVCHLKHNEWDETRTNQLAVDLFLSRATSEADKQARSKFVSYLYAEGYSNDGGLSAAAIIGIINAAIAVASTVYAIVSTRRAGWYSWNQATQKKWLETALTNSFEQSRASTSHSASQFFWAQMSGLTNKDESLEEWMGRKENEWVKAVITRYEKAYGFGFDEVTPVDLTIYPVVIIAIGAVAALLIYWIYKKVKK